MYKEFTTDKYLQGGCSVYGCISGLPTLLQIPKGVLGKFPGRRIPSLSETHFHPII